MEAVKKEIVVTKRMQREIRKFYKAQGCTNEDLRISDEGGLAPVAAPRHPGVSWRRWKTGAGWIATCTDCSHQAEFGDVTDVRKMRFQHCGRTDKFPFLLRLLAWLQ